MMVLVEPTGSSSYDVFCSANFYGNCFRLGWSCFRTYDGHLLVVVLAAWQGMQELTDDSDGRVAHVIVHMAQAFFYGLLGHGLQEFRLVAAGANVALGLFATAV